MDICNFVKVISARATKDKTLLANFVANQDTDQENAGKKTKSHHNPHISMAERHSIYQEIMQDHPELHFQSHNLFGITVKRVEKYLKEKKYYQNKNANGEKDRFLDYFSYQNWKKLHLTPT